MLIIATTKEAGASHGGVQRFRAVIRLDNVEYNLAGTYPSREEATRVAKDYLNKLNKVIKAYLKGSSIFTRYKER
jgi:hypothetical protein